MLFLESMLYAGVYTLPAVIVIFAAFYFYLRRKKRIPEWQYASCFLLAGCWQAFQGLCGVRLYMRKALGLWSFLQRVSGWLLVACALSATMNPLQKNAVLTRDLPKAPPPLQ